jgi:hypothetical protein
VLSCGLNSPDAVVELKAYLCIGVIFAEVVVVEVPILEHADFFARSPAAQQLSLE